MRAGCMLFAPCILSAQRKSSDVLTCCCCFDSHDILKQLQLVVAAAMVHARDKDQVEQQMIKEAFTLLFK
eukprot:52515-Eustigmatos_ZCMA.PRE.1